MKTKQVIIRVDAKTLREMKAIFPAVRGESKAKYLRRYVAELKRMQLKGVKYT